MTTGQLIDSGLFELIHEGNCRDQEISTPFCCDLLSLAMGRAPRDCAWVTVIGNKNTLAVATLVKAACIILAEGVVLDDETVEKAKEHGITVLSTELPVFEAALAVFYKAKTYVI
ncbi:hypothetical protein [Lacrimispora algidixylanolytica]|uniref:DRTGG domain-containing protein n=1 Tax=Lacrimispora algidixylanolytica TaxID=94868 RepID=A0A419T286_9FIRM|nr:hypothetical protein [Lacrimispora algidixylanolytica]RKD31607.1 hypothetical protein BET01_19970 [Lacrimispora algidixylanolytica]